MLAIADLTAEAKSKGGEGGRGQSRRQRPEGLSGDAAEGRGRRRGGGRDRNGSA